MGVGVHTTEKSIPCLFPAEGAARNEHGIAARFSCIHSLRLGMLLVCGRRNE